MLLQEGESALDYGVLCFPREARRWENLSPRTALFGSPLTDRTGPLKPGKNVRSFTVETEIRQSTGVSIDSSMSLEH